MPFTVDLKTVRMKNFIFVLPQFFKNLRGIGYRRWEWGKIAKVGTWKPKPKHSNWYRIQKSIEQIM